MSSTVILNVLVVVDKVSGLMKKGPWSHCWSILRLSHFQTLEWAFNLFLAKQKKTWLSSLKLCEKNNAENENLNVFLQQMDIWESFSITKFVKSRHFQYEHEKKCEKSHVLAWERWREKGLMSVQLNACYVHTFQITGLSSISSRTKAFVSIYTVDAASSIFARLWGTVVGVCR